MRGPEAEKNGENEEIYGSQLIGGISASIVEAFRSLQPAEIGWATGSLPDEVFNRRWFMKPGTIPPSPFGGTSDLVRMNPPFASPGLLRPSGPIDPEVVVLSVRTADGRPLALLANYSLHYVGGTPAGQVSADYFGEFARAIGARLGVGDDFVGILSNGASGNINNHDFSKPRLGKQPFEQVRHVAGHLADVVFRAYGEIEHEPSAQLAIAQSELPLRMRMPTPEILTQSQVLSEGVSPADRTRRHIYAQRALDLQNGPNTVATILQAIRVGGVGIAALPFETFVETGLAIKQQSPFRPTFVIELANGANGYLPTPEHHKLGGYEKTDPAPA